jgi:hypothetical protein
MMTLMWAGGGGEAVDGWGGGGWGRADAELDFGFGSVGVDCCESMMVTRCCSDKKQQHAFCSK